tara:strand:- start:20350 stop:21264 length:915 start_codon:yes stop_codon:yes gene_type:complete
LKEIIESPLDRYEQADLKEIIRSSDLTRLYKDHLGIDVSENFCSHNKIYVYECKRTTYRFYYPQDISGTDEFYQKLENLDWYYMKWKWEHETVKKKLKGNEKILEIGSGGLGFIEKMKNEGFDITGLELNSKSISKAKDLHLNVFNESVQEHSKDNGRKYDVVCSFQVLEHIAEVRTFLQAQIDCLKTGGSLIISVPNNDSFLGLDKTNCLNLPPHHMGLWNEKSLSNLPLVFPNLKLNSIIREPLQGYQKKYFGDVMSKHYIEKFKIKNAYMVKITRRMVNKFHFLFSEDIKAFTIQAIYKKT